MQIFTSSWFAPLPASIQRIGVWRGIPHRQPAGFRMMRELSPGPWFNSVSPQEYRRLYLDQLAALDAREILAKLGRLGEGCDVALVCFEKPDDAQWCHRGYLAGWFHDQLGLKVFEHGYERHGCGWRHPKIPRDLTTA